MKPDHKTLNDQQVALAWHCMVRELLSLSTKLHTLSTSELEHLKWRRWILHQQLHLDL
jgi:hypothetical protein